MTPEIQRRLAGINAEFYRRTAAAFAASRATPPPGFTSLLPFLPRPCLRLLDLGCGEGRLGRFLHARELVGEYVGLDQNAALLTLAAQGTEGTFIRRDLTAPGCLDGLGRFAAIACLATLQHVPGEGRRLALLRSMVEHLEPDGVIWLSTWQFLDSARQRRKIRPWSSVGIDAADLEPGDYLLSWQRERAALRYVCFLGPAAIAGLARRSGLVIRHQFRSDGQEGNLNLYSILARPAASAGGNQDAAAS